MTTATQTPEVRSSKQVDKSGTAVEKVANHGVTTIADVVVSKIAGIATREVDGVYDLGGQAARVVGKLRETLPGSPSLTQGVSVEVGERQAAIDIGIVADYGIAIHDLAEGIRSNVISSVENMTGLEVTEVNVTVHDVHFADGDDDASDAGEPRVQ
ncbi:Asp23/Gls24 family envelope stress response protein [Mycobacteroides franklinii]|uniref:Asp23/Gls24 family envelope stress response protein n=1 Tax=Mycobacteroides franklinii TaxID=948102 RepID=UPI000993A439|nr:Asp23/Gls24 family envelope stress response protein [Mycobacteroides franklinii]